MYQFLWRGLKSYRSRHNYNTAIFLVCTNFCEGALRATDHAIIITLPFFLVCTNFCEGALRATDHAIIVTLPFFGMYQFLWRGLKSCRSRHNYNTAIFLVCTNFCEGALRAADHAIIIILPFFGMYQFLWRGLKSYRSCHNCNTAIFLVCTNFCEGALRATDHTIIVTLPFFWYVPIFATEFYTQSYINIFSHVQHKTYTKNFTFFEPCIVIYIYW